MVRIHLPLPLFQWPGGQEVKTSPFHGGNTGSIPVRVTILLNLKVYLGRIAQLVRAFASHARGQGFESLCVHHRLTGARASKKGILKRSEPPFRIPFFTKSPCKILPLQSQPNTHTQHKNLKNWWR